MIYDVAVIGGGVSGSMCAYALSKYDLTIALIEKNSDVGAGVSKANSGIVHAGFDAKEGTLKAKLNVKGCLMMEDVCLTLGVPYKKCGSLVVGFSKEDDNTLKELLERGIKNGVSDLRIVNAEELHKMEENISPNATSALWAPTAGIVCPYTLAAAGIDNAVSNGAEAFLETEVIGIENGDECINILTSKGVIKARFAVNTAGIYADNLARLAGDDVPLITPRRGEYFLLDKKSPVRVSSTVFTCPSAAGKGVLVSPTTHGNILIGPNAEAIEDKNGTETTSLGGDAISKGARLLVPDISLRDTITSFSGIRPTPSTHDFMIEPSKKIKGLINAVGIESPGLASSPATGEYIRDMLFSLGLKGEKRENYISTRTKSGNFKLFMSMTEEEKAAAMKKDSSYGKIICRCESVTEGDIRACLALPVPPTDIDGVKRRTRSGMGRCQGGFCSSFVAKLISEVRGIPLEDITKCGAKSRILIGKTQKGGDIDE